MMPTTVNFILRDIVKAYNEEENERAKRERRKPEELPHISAPYSQTYSLYPGWQR